ncbi:MAG: hypothetical protein K0S07_390 [Chlamydiales bacterium]|nr:hypothetical protein [Chlamydiales bacterium]
MEKFPYSQIQKGTFLIASPEIESGIFFRSVVLICEHNAQGSFGLLVNKPLQLELPDELFNLEESHPRLDIRAGGPVQPNQMMLLHTSEKNEQQTLAIANGLYLGGDLQFLQKVMTEPEEVKMALCFGYAGWGAGQLEREFLDGHWFLHPAEPRYIFDISLEKMWQTLLREMGGKYAALSMIPEDLSLN